MTTHSYILPRGYYTCKVRSTNKYGLETKSDETEAAVDLSVAFVCLYSGGLFQKCSSSPHIHGSGSCRVSIYLIAPVATLAQAAVATGARAR